MSLMPTRAPRVYRGRLVGLKHDFGLRVHRPGAEARSDTEAPAGIWSTKRRALLRPVAALRDDPDQAETIRSEPRLERIAQRSATREPTQGCVVAYRTAAAAGKLATRSRRS